MLSDNLIKELTEIQNGDRWVNGECFSFQRNHQEVERT